MNLLLVCETAIIEHIFELICKKLDIKLTTQKNTNIDEKFDLIIIDQNFIDDRFNIIKQFSKRLGAISSEELSFDKSKDFLIPRPFLPTKLESILKEQIELVKESDKKNAENTIFKSINNPTPIEYEENEENIEDEEVTIPVTSYVESLADEIYNDIEEENDESIVSVASLNNGGVLDSSELGKISDLLREETLQNEINLEKNDWKNISDIIDDALDEVREYEFSLEKEKSEPYNLILNKFHIDELKPLLEKFDQSIIDRLASGEEVDVKIVLKEKN